MFSLIQKRKKMFIPEYLMLLDVCIYYSFSVLVQGLKSMLKDKRALLRTHKSIFCVLLRKHFLPKSQKNFLTFTRCWWWAFCLANSLIFDDLLSWWTCSITKSEGWHMLYAFPPCNSWLITRHTRNRTWSTWLAHSASTTELQVVTYQSLQVQIPQ